MIGFKDAWEVVKIVIQGIGRVLKIYKHRSEEELSALDKLTAITDSPTQLAKLYVVPNCQNVAPMEHAVEGSEDMNSESVPKENLFRFLRDEFFDPDSFRSADGRHHLVVVSDAGMGKSSLLAMLKYQQLNGGWKGCGHFEVLKLGKTTLDDIEAIENPSQATLLLDALDEDPTSWDRVDERVKELFFASEGFRYTIITCRSQFFPMDFYKGDGKLEVAGFSGLVKHLSFFDRVDTQKYLAKRFPTEWWRLGRSRNRELFEQAQRTVDHMASLSARPLLLSHIEDLRELPDDAQEYEVYTELVDSWLRREQRKLKGSISKSDLLQACIMLAQFLAESKKLSLDKSDITQVSSDPKHAFGLQEIDITGRSLLNCSSAGNIRFSHKSVFEYLLARGIVEREIPPQVLDTDMLSEKLVSFLLQCPHSLHKDVQHILLSNNTGSLRVRGQFFERFEFESLAQSRFDGCTFVDCKFMGDIEEVQFMGCEFISCDFSDVKITDCTFEPTAHRKLGFYKNEFQNTSLEGCYFGNPHEILGGSFSRYWRSNYQEDFAHDIHPSILFAKELSLGRSNVMQQFHQIEADDFYGDKRVSGSIADKLKQFNDGDVLRAMRSSGPLRHRYVFPWLLAMSAEPNIMDVDLSSAKLQNVRFTKCAFFARSRLYGKAVAFSQVCFFQYMPIGSKNSFESGIQPVAEYCLALDRRDIDLPFSGGVRAL